MLSVNVLSESAYTVDGHGVHSAFTDDVALLGRLPEIAVSVNRLRRADIHHAHTVGPGAMTLLRAGRRRVITAHLTQSSLAGSLRGDRYWHRAFARRLRNSYNAADVVVAVSRGVRDELLDLGVEKPIHILPNSVDVPVMRAATVSQEESRELLGVKQETLVIVGVGQVQPRKGIDTFIECARAVPEASFYWIGGMIFGPLADRRNEMRSLIAEAPDNVRFTGPLERNHVFRYLKAADLFFLPSRQENCPVAVLEAAALEVPILLRNLPQYKDQFGDACSYGDEHTFAGLIGRFLGDRSFTAERSVVAGEMAAGFDSSAKAPRLLEVYRSALHSP